MVLTFVTGNARVRTLDFVVNSRSIPSQKLAEVNAILSSGTAIELQSRDLDVPEIQGTTQEVALAKCKAAARIINGPCVTEDTALCFEALKGLPGPYIKHFLAALGHEGLNTMLDGFDSKRATALCTFAYCASPDEEPILFEGRTEGEIVPARGDSTFGWDPIFYVTEAGMTFGEMEPAAKNKISHRYRALEKLRQHLVAHPPPLQ